MRHNTKLLMEIWILGVSPMNWTADLTALSIVNRKEAVAMKNALRVLKIWMIGVSPPKHLSCGVQP